MSNRTSEYLYFIPPCRPSSQPLPAIQKNKRSSLNHRPNKLQRSTRVTFNSEHHGITTSLVHPMELFLGNVHKALPRKVQSSGSLVRRHGGAARPREKRGSEEVSRASQISLSTARPAQARRSINKKSNVAVPGYTKRRCRERKSGGRDGGGGGGGGCRTKNARSLSNAVLAAFRDRAVTCTRVRSDRCGTGEDRRRGTEGKKEIGSELTREKCCGLVLR